MVRICDAYAKNANKLKMTILMVLYTGYGLGNIMTTITTNSAYKINSHVIIAQIMPQISCKQQKTRIYCELKPFRKDVAIQNPNLSVNFLKTYVVIFKFQSHWLPTPLPQKYCVSIHMLYVSRMR